MGGTERGLEALSMWSTTTTYDAMNDEREQKGVRRLGSAIDVVYYYYYYCDEP